VWLVIILATAFSKGSSVGYHWGTQSNLESALKNRLVNSSSSSSSSSMSDGHLNFLKMHQIAISGEN